ncbi:MAG: hypothetical protein KatS3mg057_2122 [Herpetosiphonaceae bacterium]|nr:MAG: hypothetical protein KatS3mg057_2122 [Herpetosiphonaceae bacterium]
MSALSRFEQLVENMFEGSVARLFRSRIQPAEIARRLERAMESQQTISVDRVLVPNIYRVYLHPEDFAAFQPYKASLEREMATYLIDLARERSFSMVEYPRVDMLSDPGVSKRHIQVVAELQEVGPDLGGTTQVISVDGGPAARQRPQPRAYLILQTDQGEHMIPLESTQVTLGRALNNEIILEDSRVSRHHAQIHYKARRFWVTDLGSTNGTFINGEPIMEQPLRSGDVLSLGGLELLFREG